MSQIDSCSNFLDHKFKSIQQVNPRFSLRAFAKRLDLSPSKVSEYINGKRLISLKTALHIAEKLKLNDDEKELLCFLTLKNSQKDRKKTCLFEEVNDNELTLIRDWEHFAILSYIETCPKKRLTDLQHASKRMSISQERFISCLNRLVKMDLVIKSNISREYYLNTKGIKTKTQFSNEDLRHSHKQSLNQAIEAIDNFSHKDRDVSSITMAIDKAQLPQAKKMILQFRRQLMEFMESGDQNEVYNLNIQFYPITRDLNEKILH